MNQVKVSHPSMAVGEVKVREIHARARRCGATVDPRKAKMKICVRRVPWQAPAHSRYSYVLAATMASDVKYLEALRES